MLRVFIPVFWLLPLTWLALELLTQSVGPESLVAIVLDELIDQVVALLEGTAATAWTSEQRG